MNRGTVLALVAMGLRRPHPRRTTSPRSTSRCPSIEKAFDTDVSTVQWVINAYALVFGVLIVTGGRLADMFGRRRVFFIGAGIFMVMSVLGGVAQNEYWLIAARALMGVGGALMWPAILGMTFARCRRRRQAWPAGSSSAAPGSGRRSGRSLGGMLTAVPELALDAVHQRPDRR